MHRLFCIVIALQLASPAMGQAARDGTGANAWRPPIEPLTGLPLPLLEGEWLGQFEEGCRVVYDVRVPKDTNTKGVWHGACRFGLIDGPGFLLMKMPDSTSQFFPFTARLGRFEIDRSLNTHVPRSEANDTAWFIKFHESPQAAHMAEQAENQRVLGASATNPSRSWSAVLGSFRRTSDKEDVIEGIRVGQGLCPVTLSGQRTEERLAPNGVVGEQAKKLVPYCQNALIRLQREGRMYEDRPFEPGAFNEVDYGHYAYVEAYRVTNTPTGMVYSTEGKVLCPELHDVGSCEAIWRPFVQPYLAIRDAGREAQAQQERKREAMIAALEAAFAEKRQKVIATAKARTSR